MIASERLVQRFVDQELSADERVQFVVRLARDADLRAQVIALERLVSSAGRLPRPVVPDGFVAGVMQRTAAPERRGRWRQLIDPLWTPHVLRWNLASAAALAGLALIIAGSVVGVSRRRERAPDAVRPQTAAVPTRDRSTVLVRLVIVQPGARMVQVAGDFNGWNPARTPLEEVSAGAWAVTIPLEPGRYKYMYVIDGRRWIADPFAAEQYDDGFGSQNAVLEVRPPAGAKL